MARYSGGFWRSGTYETSKTDLWPVEGEEEGRKSRVRLFSPGDRWSRALKVLRRTGKTCAGKDELCADTQTSPSAVFSREVIMPETRSRREWTVVEGRCEVICGKSVILIGMVLLERWGKGRGGAT